MIDAAAAAKGEIEELSNDATLDDVEDLPGFGIPLTGAYQVIIKDTDWDKLVNDKSAINYEFMIEEIHEVTEEPEDGEAAPKIGDIFSSFWFKNNKFALDIFKKKLALPISKRLGTTVVREIVEQSKGLQMMMVIKRKRDKKDKDVFRLEIKMAAVL